MRFRFPPAPTYEGLTYLNTERITSFDARAGRLVVFPIYNYRDDETGELVQVMEPQFEAIVDKMIAMGMFGPKAGRA